MAGDPKGIALEIVNDMQTVGQWLDGNFQTLQLFGGLIQEPELPHMDPEPIDLVQAEKMKILY